MIRYGWTLGGVEGLQGYIPHTFYFFLLSSYLLYTPNTLQPSTSPFYYQNSSGRLVESEWKASIS